MDRVLDHPAGAGLGGDPAVVVRGLPGRAAAVLAGLPRPAARAHPQRGGARPLHARDPQVPTGGRPRAGRAQGVPPHLRHQHGRRRRRLPGEAAAPAQLGQGERGRRCVPPPPRARRPRAAHPRPHAQDVRRTVQAARPVPHRPLLPHLLLQHVRAIRVRLLAA